MPNEGAVSAEDQEFSDALRSALHALWQLPISGLQNPSSDPNYRALLAALRTRCVGADTFGGTLAISNALRQLGLPCGLATHQQHLSPDAEQAVVMLEAALAARSIDRMHLIPLDLADHLPELAFGNARVSWLTEGELSTLVDLPRLERTHSEDVFDLAKFSQFQWLVIRESVPLQYTSAGRHISSFHFDTLADLGRIEPHSGKFPEPVESALFWLALAPWEDWVDMPEIDWRGFRAPWVYTIDHDMFASTKRPPSPDSLNWAEKIFQDAQGHIHEELRPLVLGLSDVAGPGLTDHLEQRQVAMERVSGSALFEPPVVHFFVRAFLSDGMDEFLAHMLAIEAAIGLRMDHKRKMSTGINGFDHLSATSRIVARISALLGDTLAGQYKELFDIRSEFIHGRPMAGISTGERVMARILARKVVDALVNSIQTQQQINRGDYLDALLIAGAGSTS